MLKLQVCPGLWCPLNVSHEAVIKFLFWKSTAPRKHSPSGCAPADCSFLPSRDSLFHTRVSDSEIKRCIVGSLPYNVTHREVTVVVICCCRNKIELNWNDLFSLWEQVWVSDHHSRSKVGSFALFSFSSHLTWVMTPIVQENAAACTRTLSAGVNPTEPWQRQYLCAWTAISRFFSSTQSLTKNLDLGCQRHCKALSTTEHSPPSSHPF